MNQVTAIYQNGEIGYGEGEGLDYAIEECLASISPIFENEMIVLQMLHGEEFHRVHCRLYLNMSGELAIVQ
jgi:hypothetical protein